MMGGKIYMKIFLLLTSWSLTYSIMKTISKIILSDIIFFYYIKLINNFLLHGCIFMWSLATYPTFLRNHWDNFLGTIPMELALELVSPCYFQCRHLFSATLFIAIYSQNNFCFIHVFHGKILFCIETVSLEYLFSCAE